MNQARNQTGVLYEFTVGPWYVVENDMVCWLMSIEDWDAMVASLGPAMSDRSMALTRQCGGSGYRTTAEPDENLRHSTGPTSLAERMDAEGRSLERLGRKVAFWAIFGLAVTILSWWILR